MTEPTLNLQSLLDKLLATGKGYVEKGQDYAEDKLNIPEAGPEREVMLDGMKKGALASALLVGLLGTKGGRSLTGTALKIGGLAALGTVAFRAFNRWQQGGDDSAPIHLLSESEAGKRGELLIQAMVAAANADGRVDDDEHSKIKHQVLQMRLPQEQARRLEQIIDSPLTAEEIGNNIHGLNEAGEVYLATRLLIDDSSSDQEQSYLDRLVTVLGLSDEQVAELESHLT